MSQHELGVSRFVGFLPSIDKQGTVYLLPPDPGPSGRERLADGYGIRKRRKFDPLTHHHELPPSGPHLPVGNPADDARAAAIQAGITATIDYNAAADPHSDDEDDYAEMIDLWNQRQNVIWAANQQHHTDCLQALETAYMNVDSAADTLTLAYQDMAIGDEKIRDGGAEQNMMAKVGLYNAAKTAYESCSTRAGQAATKHAPFQTAHAAAMAILNLYG